MKVPRIKSVVEDKKTPLQYDFLKDVRKIMRGDFPKMRRMKRRLVLEGVAMICLGMICGWMNYTQPYGSVWITVIIIIFVAAFMTLEIFAFRAYWYTPADISYAEAARKFSARLNSVTDPMKVINMSLALVIVVLLIVDTNLISILTWQMGVLLLLVQVSFSIFSARWIAHAKLARRQANKFKVTSEKQHEV